MLARERQNKIVEMVNANGSVLVKELSEMFEVTEDSIRKDLSLLEKKELLKKTSVSYTHLTLPTTCDV